MTISIAFVGAGPTTLYTLAALLAESAGPPRIAITVYEEQDTAGLGGPYRPGWNDPAMLSNIASIEIPPIGETLLDWLEQQSPAELERLGVDPALMNARTFVPRVALGAWFRDRFDVLVEQARARGIGVEILTGCRVIDVAIVEDGIRLTVSPGMGLVSDRVFDYAVLATGHQWPSHQQIRPGYFTSPWPAAGLSGIGPVAVGVRGSSLTAIDAAVAVAGAHGRFVRRDGRLVYEPGPNTDAFRITMMSRKGLLPEADFYFPLPHEPLSICTPAALETLVAQGGGNLLDRAFDLFRRELRLADPAYCDEMGLEGADLETFGERYFARRASADPFEWAEANLEEAKANHATGVTVAWRYAILQMHEVFADLVPHLTGTGLERFDKHLKPVFVDDYGAVPHESIERMLALHRAGRLDILALGDAYRIDTRPPEGGAVLEWSGRRLHFPAFIEATGQGRLSGLQFPFLTLLEQGIVQDHIEEGSSGVSRGILIDGDYHPVADGVPVDRLFCLSLPFIMGRHPFAQGITSSHDMGVHVAGVLAGIIGATDALSDLSSDRAA